MYLLLLLVWCSGAIGYGHSRNSRFGGFNSRFVLISQPTAKKHRFLNTLDAVADIAISPSFRPVTRGLPIEGATARRVTTMLAAKYFCRPGQTTLAFGTVAPQRFIVFMMLTAAR